MDSLRSTLEDLVAGYLPDAAQTAALDAAGLIPFESEVALCIDPARTLDQQERANEAMAVLRAVDKCKKKYTSGPFKGKTCTCFTVMEKSTIQVPSSPPSFPSQSPPYQDPWYGNQPDMNLESSQWEVRCCSGQQVT
jgi:hypothetical protein